MKKKKKNSSAIFLLCFIFVGLSIMLYPAVSNYWNSRTQSQAIVDYESSLKNTPQADYTAFFEKAEEYNRELAQLPAPLEYRDSLPDYDSLLDPSGTGMMGYVTIEKISIELPIYHGTSEAVLNNAVGHIEGSSLPIGGESTHSIISAHRGLPSSTLFTNLDHMEIGDIFVISILDKTYTYQVDQIKTVIPSDTQHLAVKEGKDYCTLLTCTPYGINSHRLLVRGRRIESIQEKKIHITSDGYLIDTLIVTPAVALPILLVLIIYVLFKPVKKSNKRILKEIKEEGENDL